MWDVFGIGAMPWYMQAYHAPKLNCSVVDVVDVVEAAMVCTPAFETVCEKIEVPMQTSMSKTMLNCTNIRSFRCEHKQKHPYKLLKVLSKKNDPIKTDFVHELMFIFIFLFKKC